MNRVYRSEHDRVIAGVCGGLAAYMRIDPLIVRVVFALFAMMNGVGLLAYLVLWVLLPSESARELGQSEVHQQNVNEIGARARQFVNQARSALGRDATLDPWAPEGKADSYLLIAGVVLVGLGLLMLMGNLGLFWWVSLRRLWPLALVAVGAVLLLNNLRDRR